MAGLLYSISRIWIKSAEQPSVNSVVISQAETSINSDILDNNDTGQSGSTFDTHNNVIGGVSDTSIATNSQRRRSSKTTLNPCTGSASSPSCLISGYPRSALAGRSKLGEKLEFPFVGLNRSEKFKPKHIMWEDSGYESPNQKRESQTSVAAEKDLPILEKKNSDILNCYDDGKPLFVDINANTSKTCNSIDGESYREKYSIPSTQYDYIPPTIQNYHYQPRRPQRSRQGVDHDKSSNSNDMNLPGMSPMYTSTPIKSSPKLDFDVLKLSDDGSSSFPTELFSFNSPSQQQLNCSEGDTSLSFNLSLTKEMVDESVSKIVEEGSEEFRVKYSQWIAQVFHFQLEKMQRRLTNQFSKNMESITREKEREIISLQQKYRNKLIEFEASTEKFQKWIETLADENQRVRDTKDAIISEMQHTTSNQKENFRIELEKQINNVQAECEKEKLVLQRKHADQLKNINQKSMGQVTKLEEQFGKQVDSLQALIGELKSQNVTMEEQLSVFKKSSDEQHNVLHNKYVNYHKEREQMLGLINDLREKLSQSEKEKSVIIGSHNEEIFNIQKESERINQNVSTRMINSQSVVEALQKKHEEETSYLKKQIVLQESQYKQAIDDLRNTYGQRISHLTKTVEGLQHELMGGRKKTSNLV